MDRVGQSGYRVQAGQADFLPLSEPQLEFPLRDPKIKRQQRLKRRKHRVPADVAQIWFERMRQAAKA